VCFWVIVEDEVLQISDFHCLETHVNLMRTLTGRRERISVMRSKGRIGREDIVAATG